MSEERDDFYDSKWFRSLIVAAVVSGAGGSIGTLTKDASDRYKGADARADFAERDAEIARLRQKVNAHESHSATYTQIIVNQQRDIDRLEAMIQKHIESHH